MNAKVYLANNGNINLNQISFVYHAIFVPLSFCVASSYSSKENVKSKGREHREKQQRLLIIIQQREREELLMQVDRNMLLGLLKVVLEGSSSFLAYNLIQCMLHDDRASINCVLPSIYLPSPLYLASKNQYGSNDPSV